MRPVLAVSRRLSSRRLDAERLHDRPIDVDEHEEPARRQAPLRRSWRDSVPAFHTTQME